MFKKMWKKEKELTPIPYNLFQNVEEMRTFPNLLYEANSTHILKPEKDRKRKRWS